MYRFVFCLFLLGQCLARPDAAAAERSSVPNIVVILMDDLGYGDIGAFGSRANRTPHLDRLAAEGMRLTSFYGAPVCTASRAQLLTGSYAKRVSLSGVLFPVGRTGLNPAEPTIAKLLKARGYATMCVGKWHLGDQGDFLPTRHGFDHFFGLPYSNDMGERVRPASAQNKGGPKAEDRPPLPLLRGENVIEAPVEQTSLTARFTEEAVRFIRTNRARPFFLYLAHTAVHVPLFPGKAFQGKSQNGAYGDWVEESDWSVGQVVDALRELQLDRNTLVFFTSDNGPWLSRGKAAGVATPLRGGKFSCWEGGLRVPTIAWWPGRVPAGSRCDAVAGNIDLLPTLVGLAGGRMPTAPTIDGRDLWPLLSGATGESPHPAYFYWNYDTLGAVRSGPWKLVVRAQRDVPDAPGAGQREPPATFVPQLYNLDQDIGETTDVAAQHPEVVRRLLAHTERMDRDLGTSRTPGPGVRPAGSVVHPVPLRQTTAKAPPPLTPESEILAQVTPLRPLRGGVIPADIATVLGTTHVGGRYHFTAQPYLQEGAEKVLSLGYRSVKFWFSGVERGYSFNSDWRLPEGHSLEQLARHPYFEAVFGMPFAVIALEVMPVRAPPGFGPAKGDLLDPAYDFSRDEEQLYALTRHLYRTYRARDVTFLLQNWEGDWMFRGSAREGWMQGQYPQLARRVEAFTHWINARQRGVERARAEAVGAKCRVWHAVEVNRVFDLLKGIPTMTTHVLPYVRPDFISWSCYDGLNTAAGSADKSAVGLWRGLDLIQHYARTTRQDAAGRPAVFIGEIGFPENITNPERAVTMMDGALGTLLARKVPYVLYWELFCNERKDGTRPKPVRSEPAQDLRGFWLVQPDGSLGGVGAYFSQLLSHAGGRLPNP